MLTWSGVMADKMADVGLMGFEGSERKSSSGESLSVCSGWEMLCCEGLCCCVVLCLDMLCCNGFCCWDMLCCNGLCCLVKCC